MYDCNALCMKASLVNVKSDLLHRIALSMSMKICLKATIGGLAERKYLISDYFEICCFTMVCSWSAFKM